MAINFLNHIDLNRNEIQNSQLIKAQVDNQINDAGVGGNPVEGQLYFNTTVDALKIYANGAWAEVGATSGVETFTNANGTFVSAATVNTGAIGAVTTGIIDLSATGTKDATTFLRGDNTWAPTAAIPGTYNWEVQGDSGSNVVIGSGDFVDHRGMTGISTTIASIAGGSEVRIDLDDTAVVPGSYTYASLTVDQQGRLTAASNGVAPSFFLGGDTGPVQTITNGDTLGILGGNYASTIAGATDEVRIDVDATIAETAGKVIARDATGYGYVETPASGDNTTKIATTAFVQLAVTGLLEFKSGFNATTGAIVSGGNLTSGGSRVAVSVGDYYVVTVAGNFFGNTATPLTPGDSVIVQTAAGIGASVEADFIVVQSDTDLATLSTVGIGNVNAETDSTLKGISVSYSSGTAEVGLDIDGLPTQTLPGATDISIPYINDVTSDNYKATLSDLVVKANTSTSKTGTIAIGSYFGTVVHDFGINTMVQTIDSSGNTVYCDVTRTGITSPYTVTATIIVPSLTAITILVQKIG